MSLLIAWFYNRDKKRARQAAAAARASEQARSVGVEDVGHKYESSGTSTPTEEKTSVAEVPALAPLETPSGIATLRS